MEIKTPPKIHTYAYHICRAWYNGPYTMATKPIKFLVLHYTMTQFLISSDISSVRGHSEKWTVFQERSSRKLTVSFVSPQIRNIVLMMFGILLQHAQLIKLENITRLCPSFSWGIFSHVTRLDQSCEIEIFHWLITDNPTKSGLKWREKPRTRFSSRPGSNQSSELLNLKYENYFFCTGIYIRSIFYMHIVETN